MFQRNKGEFNKEWQKNRLQSRSVDLDDITDHAEFPWPKGSMPGVERFASQGVQKQ